MSEANHWMETLIKNEAAAGYNWTLTDTRLTWTELNIIKENCSELHITFWRTYLGRRTLTNTAYSGDKEAVLEYL